jgi:hypothetical protein
VASVLLNSPKSYLVDWTDFREARQISPGLFVGPQIRDGFADVTAGIRDSILDIQEKLRPNGFALAASPESATIVVVVLGRGIVNGGSIGFSNDSTGFVVPYEKPTVSALLRVGTYELLLQSEGSTWRDAADQIIEDVQAWWDVNRSKVE